MRHDAGYRNAAIFVYADELFERFHIKFKAVDTVENYFSLEFVSDAKDEHESVIGNIWLDLAGKPKLDGLRCDIVRHLAWRHHETDLTDGGYSYLDVDIVF